MIKIENTVLPSQEQWKSIIMGTRNPMNSWAKSDTDFDQDKIEIGEKDLELMSKLANAGSDHGKFLRMIPVYCDITAPLYWVAEHDTYKIGTVRNSCSFMHKGTSKEFDIEDFSIQDERIYEILGKKTKEPKAIEYPYETNEYKLLITDNGREYKIFKNGKIISCEFFVEDTEGRKRHFKEKNIIPYLNSYGYYEVHIGGRKGHTELLHRIVASLFVENPNGFETVNHKNGNKADNSAENLEWLSREENIKKGFEEGLYDNIKSISSRYKRWKNGMQKDPKINFCIKKEKESGVSTNELVEKYKLTKTQINNIVFGKQIEDEEVFVNAFFWETIINGLNKLRSEYLETEDEEIFFQIRQLLPQGYNIRYTWQTNYQVLKNIYYARKNHRLPEWHVFCDWIETLPYFNELIKNKKEGE